jgi:hypothetical protein
MEYALLARLSAEDLQEMMVSEEIDTKGSVMGVQICTVALEPFYNLTVKEVLWACRYAAAA